jgi:hypothetical protein
VFITCKIKVIQSIFYSFVFDCTMPHTDPTLKTKPTGPKLKVTDVTKLKETIKNPVKYTTFLITVSTNVRPHTEEEGRLEAGRLNGALALTYTHANLKKLFKFLSGGTYSTTMKDVDVKYAIELGPSKQGGRIHAHTLMKLKHTSKGLVHINIPVLRHVLLRSLKAATTSTRMALIKNIHIDIKVANDQRTLEDYLTKDAVRVNKTVKEVNKDSN